MKTDVIFIVIDQPPFNMKCLPLLLIIFFVFTSSPKVFAQWNLDVESGMAFQNYNDVRILNQTGTLFDFNKDFELQGPVIPIRVRAGYTFNEKNHLFALWSPLQINYQGAAPRAIQFQNSLFSQGERLDGVYKFNSYRLTYRRDLIQSSQWVLGLGFTAKIRDASVQLSNESGTSEINENVGFVPLLHLYAQYGLGNAKIYFEGDGLAGGPGRAFDLFLGSRIPIRNKVDLKTGYRLLEGGADTEEIYNFTLVHYAILGVFIQL